jgi:hypothetical protein
MSIVSPGERWVIANCSSLRLIPLGTNNFALGMVAKAVRDFAEGGLWSGSALVRFRTETACQVPRYR